MKRTLLSWSSGKDSAWSLHVLRQKNEYEIVGLLTTFNQEADRVAMHAVRRSWSKRKQSGGHSFMRVIYLRPAQIKTTKPSCANSAESRFNKESITLLSRSFLDRRSRVREKQLEASGLQPVFPLWIAPLESLARDDPSGLRAKLTCIDSKALAPDFVGGNLMGNCSPHFRRRLIPAAKMGNSTPSPMRTMFEHNLSVAVGEIVTRDQFVFADLDFARAG